MTVSVVNLCNALARHLFLGPDTVRALRERWLKISFNKADDVDAFLKWLVADKTLTEYQAGVLARGNAEQLSLGQYVIQDRIGKGRMAGVYKARHRTGQTVAVKILPPSKARDAQILARFQRESRLALRLKHPNIVRTFQAGHHNGLHYIVMEHLEGEPLDEVLARRGKVAPGEAVRLVHQILLGLEELHEKGMIHRDVKPGNLMVLGGQPDSTEQATLKILDVGTGKADFDEGPSTELTNEGDFLGTPEYIAPEQARDPRNADIRADLYSVGCVLYHALAGRPPFNDVNRVRLLVKVATEAPKPVREFNPAVPEGLQQILDSMLAKDPSARYPTPQRAAKALQAFLAAGNVTPEDVADEEMRAYLGELAKEEDQESINVELIAVALPVRDPGPHVDLPVGKVVSPPPRQQQQQQAPPTAAPRRSAVPPTAAPSASRKHEDSPPPEPRRPARKHEDSPPPEPRKPPRRARDEQEEEPEDVVEVEEGKGGLFGLSSRDLIMLIIGIGGLAVVLAIGLAVFAIVNSRS